jgi:hypothetical protein
MQPVEEEDHLFKCSQISDELKSFITAQCLPSATEGLLPRFLGLLKSMRELKSPRKVTKITSNGIHMLLHKLLSINPLKRNFNIKKS